MAHLSIALLGSFRAALDGQPVTGFKYDKVRALLAYLCVEDVPHEREALLGLLWPDLPQDAARNNLRQVLLTLRNAIGDPSAQPPFVLANRTTIQWNPRSDASVDVVLLGERLAACAHHPHRSITTCNLCATQLAEAVDLYRGDFLAEFFLPDSEAFEAWALLKRESLRRSMVEALTHLIAYHERRKQYEDALHYAHRLLAIESWREETHRCLMRLYFLNNDRSAALAQYEACCHLLKQALDVDPEAETTALYQQIRAAHEPSSSAAVGLGAPRQRRYTLPSQPTPFIGRRRELAQLGALLAQGESRLITLTGPGGVGKTRLAIQVAAEQAQCFADGVYFVALAGLPHASLLPDTIAAALNLDAPPDADAKQSLLEYLVERELLLLLDNLEHLLVDSTSLPKPDRVETLLAEWLSVAPGLTVLATSRQRLNLRAEKIFRVEGLQVGVEGTTGVESEAVQLFVESAQRLTDFVLSPAEEEAVVRICQAVDGLPLALEIAAAWTRLLGPVEILQEIEQGLAFFSAPFSDLPDRHQSLTAVFTYSWQTLTVEEQRVLRHLSLFCGGFDREGAKAVANATLPILAALVDKSLIYHSQGGWYELHELIRQYAAEKLSKEEAAQARRCHAVYYLHLAEGSEPQLKGPEQAKWLEHLQREMDNLRAALQWAVDTGEMEMAGRLGVALDHFWNHYGHLHEGKRWLEEILSRLPSDDETVYALRARVLNSIGMLACDQGDYPRAIVHYEEGLSFYRAANDVAGIARVLNNLGNIYLRQNQRAQALPLFQEALALYRPLGDTWAISTLLSNIGVLLCDGGDFEGGERFYRESLVLRRQLGDDSGIATSLYNLADLLHHQGKDEEAMVYLSESLTIFRRLQYTLAIAIVLHLSGTIALWRHDLETALTHLRESLILFQELGAHHYLAAVLESFAGASGLCGEAHQAARLLGAAETLREEIGAALNITEREDYARLVTVAQQDLDGSAFATARQAGRAMALEQAVALALTITNRLST